MKKRPLGTSGLEVSEIIFGCWQAGAGKEWPGVDDRESIAAMRAALDIGINCFDTAEMYGHGHSEIIVAKALEGMRHEVLLASKVSPRHLRADQVIEACHGSLKRLRTDYLDLYQIHWPSGSWGSDVVPIEETMGAMVRLMERGDIRAIGVSNFNAEEIEEALQYGPIHSLQPPWSFFWPPYEYNGTIRTCIEHRIGVIAYSPLAQGLLAERFGPDNRPPPEDNRSDNLLFQDPHYTHALEAVEAMKSIARHYERPVSAIALQWLLAQEGCTAAIVGAKRPDQIRAHRSATDFTISSSDMEELSHIRQRVTSALPPDQTSPWPMS